MAFKAVIVGIERYDLESMNVAAPAANAVAVAKWALSAGVAPQDILAFISPLDPAVTVDLVSRGVVIRPATFEAIDTALRTELATPHGGSTLLFYWSGHGMTDNHGQRVLFCADYTPALDNRVFNASLFFRKLRGPVFTNFQQMLALADVCGVNSQTPTEPAHYDPGPAHARRHLIYFATPEGGYAVADTGEGAFTYSAVRALNAFTAWPDLEQFGLRIEAELKASQLPRYHLAVNSETDSIELRPGVTTTGADRVADELIELLANLDPTQSLLQTHYIATAEALGNPRLLGAQGLTGMVRELSALRGDIQGPTHGLIQFVLRLCADPALEPRLKAWLSARAALAAVQAETARLDQECGRNLLVLDVETDERGEIAAIRPSLRNLDFTQVQGQRFEPLAVQGWADFEPALLGLLRTLKRGGFAEDLEIHMIVEPHLFDRPFHRLAALEAGATLGEEFVVVLHHRARVSPTPSAAKRRWRETVSNLARMSPGDLNWERLVVDQTLPGDPALYFADFTVCPGLFGERGKAILARLIALGAPFIYWPHDADEPDPKERLTTLIRALATLAEMPEALQKLRIREAGAVKSGSLLWDELSFQPYGH